MQNHKPLNIYICTCIHTHNLGMGANISDDEENVELLVMLAFDKVYLAQECGDK